MDSDIVSVQPPQDRATEEETPECRTPHASNEAIATTRLQAELSERGFGDDDAKTVVGAIIQAGPKTVDELLRMDDEMEEDVRDKFGEMKVSKDARVRFKKWLTEQRATLHLRPPPGSQSAHFYGLRECLNDSDTSGLEAAIVLRVDIDPFSDGGPKSTVRIPSGALDTQVQLASKSPTPIVSLVGPTGVGNW